MTIWILGCGLEGILFLFILGCILAEGKKNRTQGKASFKGGGQNDLDRLALPVGRVLRKVFRKPTKQKRSKAYVFGKPTTRKILTDVYGQEEGEREYEQILCKKLGMGCMTLFLAGMVVLYGTLPSMQNNGFKRILERPSHGEGSQKENLSFTLETEEGTYAGSLVLTIPEKELTAEEKIAFTTACLHKVLETYEGKVVTGDLSFPSSQEGVLLHFKSLSPSVIRSDGRLMTAPSKERTPFRFLVSASLNGEETSAFFSGYLAAYQELTMEEKAAWLVREIKAGSFLTSKEMVLPQETAEGESLTWERKEEQSILFFLILLVIIPGVVLLKQDSDLRGRMRLRNQQIQSKFPDLISEVSILMGAGSSLRNTFLRLSQEYEKKKGERLKAGSLDGGGEKGQPGNGRRRLHAGSAGAFFRSCPFA